MPTPCSTARTTPARRWPRRAATSPPTRRRWAPSPRLPTAWASAHDRLAKAPSGTTLARLLALAVGRAPVRRAWFLGTGEACGRARHSAMTRKQRRGVFILLTVSVLALAVLLVAVALR